MIYFTQSPIVYLMTAIIVLSCSCKNQTKEKGCEKFRDGIFEARHRTPNNNSFLIKREGTVQTETDPQTGKYARLAIKWVDKCTYEMKLVETTFDVPDSIQSFSKRIPLTTEILRTTDDYYVCKTTINHQNPVLDTLWVSK